ncbi:hypothetical protein BD309DRAFT_963932 [Dichomitus squalens]|uniref:Uncharacterized protein n=1 Tax=Dichomitus squalens TaxID=114155 RepID=A0A4Q9NKZ3_9APHY|nr:hypothetical protein BD309DRAFT_963932 [Dichomitus squalens]TBU52707.1 hypothetical protein BD310DRAFT_939682 [Dichomitus squalens]
MSSTSFATHDDHAESSQHASKSSTGLTFVLPPLSALKAQKSKKKIKLTYEEPVKKQPRPIKLKPLREVLSKLIVQIKKKDDYAFFLQPVDPTQVPGYSDVVSKPMDFGTIATKVEKGRYRSLEEFASDVRLVTTNAKTFNPPGSIYYTEAERIESYALDQITKAAATVIEYETDWNIDVEKDDELVTVDQDDANGVAGTSADRIQGTPMDVDESRAGTPSVQVGGGKKTKGKKPPGTLSESLEPDGGLPGAKDGLGAFPPGSDEAELMLALKLKGKRYRTKKERIRMERGGPPIAPDGSLDYPEMEDPFSVLSALVPDPPSRPLLVPLYPPAEPEEPAQSQYPAPVNIIPSQDIPEPEPEPSTSTSTSSTLRRIKSAKPAKRRHWIVNRSGPTRVRIKDTGDEDVVPVWKTPREPVATDFGTYATLPSVLAQENRLQDVGADLGSEARLFDVLRRSLYSTPSVPSTEAHSTDQKPSVDEDSFWRGKAAEAEAYIRDVVYGGVDGLAYARSLAEFLTPSAPVVGNGEPPTFGALGMPVARWVEENVLDPLTGWRHGVLRDTSRILHSLPLTPPHTPPSTSTALPDSEPAPSDPIRRQIDLSLHAYPAAARALETLRAMQENKVDLPALIRSPDELFHAEDVWAGRAYREKRRREMDEALARDPEKNAAAYLQWAIAEHREAQAGAWENVGGTVAGTGTAAGAAAAGAATSGAVEDAGMLAYALDAAADEIAKLVGGQPAQAAPEALAERKGDGAVEEAQPKGEDADGDVVMKTESGDDSSAAPSASEGVAMGDVEDPVMKKLRLNLLALAKRAPLDQIMKLPPQLVPAHLRHIVPTADV